MRPLEEHTRGKIEALEGQKKYFNKGIRAGFTGLFGAAIIAGLLRSVGLDPVAATFVPYVFILTIISATFAMTFVLCAVKTTYDLIYLEKE